MSNNTAVKSKTPNIHARKLKPIDKVDIRAVEEKLIQARVSLLIQHPFFGNMATRLQIIRAESWCDTAATDGRHFYYNPSFIDSLTNKQVEFLFGHEVLHNVFEHLLRRDERNPKLWNISADYCVNQTLLDNNIGRIIPDCLYDTKYKDWSAEQVYEQLNEEYGQNGKTYEECVEEATARMLDDHFSNDMLDEREDGKPYLSESDKQKIRDEVREGLIASASQAAGKLPLGVKRLVDNLTHPKMNWRDLLRQHIQSCISSDYSYLRPNRKTLQQGIILPGVIKGETVSLCIAVDASGSISQEDVSDFLSEVNGIMSQYDDFEIRIWSFDTQVYNDTTFSLNSGDDIYSYEIKGGGGTSFNANWEYMKNEGIEPNIFVMFTDGYTGDGWGDPDYCETIFIVKHNKTAEAPHGITVIYEDL